RSSERVDRDVHERHPAGAAGTDVVGIANLARREGINCSTQAHRELRWRYHSTQKTSENRKASWERPPGSAEWAVFDTLKLWAWQLALSWLPHCRGRWPDS